MEGNSSSGSNPCPRQRAFDLLQRGDPLSFMLNVFTIKQLQDALGLSYHQTYRLLHGYSNSKASYSGILDKCPAISFIDATVAEELYGVSLKRREHYFSFDAEMYRLWSAKAQIWLEEEEHKEEKEDNNNDHDHDDDKVTTPPDDVPSRSWKMSDETKRWVTVGHTPEEQESLLRQIANAENEKKMQYFISVPTAYYEIEYGLVKGGGRGG